MTQTHPMSRRLTQARRGLLGLLVVAAAVLAIAAVTERNTNPASPVTAPGVAVAGSFDRRVPEGTVDAAAARTALETLTVAHPSEQDGYDRDCGRGHGCVFGAPWSDNVIVAFGHNGCDTRNDVLRRDFDPATLVVGEPNRPCRVLGGALRDPYTGHTLTFDPARPQAIHIDHIVSAPATDCGRVSAGQAVGSISVTAGLIGFDTPVKSTGDGAS